MSKEQQKLVSEDCERIFTIMSEKLTGLANSSLLVTGGAGFMGSWVSELVHYMNRFHKMNIRLFILDRNLEKFENNLPHIAQSKYIEFIRCDVRNITEIPHDVNYIIHGAAKPDTRDHSSIPMEIMATIANGTGSLLHAANRASNLKKFLNISSCSVYSMTKNKKISEESIGLPLDVMAYNPYAEAKRFSEMLCSAARSEDRIPVVTVRPFTFCGAYQDLHSPWALNNFINDVLNNRPIKILGDGNTIRSYMYGADYAAWLLVILLSSTIGTIFNVGSDKGTTLNNLAIKVSRLSKISADILLNASLSGPVANTSLVPDTRKVFDKLGLSQITDIDTAIERTLKWYELDLISKNK